MDIFLFPLSQYGGKFFPEEMISQRWNAKCKKQSRQLQGKICSQGRTMGKSAIVQKEGNLLYI